MYKASLPTTAHRPSLLERIGNSIVRHPVRATALGILSVVALLACSIVGAALQAKAMEHRSRIALAAQFERNTTRQIRKLEEEIDETRQRLNNEPGLSVEERSALQEHIEELSTVRDARVKQVDMALVTVLPLLMRKDSGEEGAALMTQWRKARINEIARMVKEGKLYDAHHNIWMFLRNAQSVPWSHEDLDALMRAKTRVETALATGQADFKIPDWARYEPPIPLLQYLVMSSGGERTFPIPTPASNGSGEQR